MREFVERVQSVFSDRDTPLFAAARSRDLPEAERQKVASLLPKLIALIAVTFAATLAVSWWLGPGAVPAAVASTTAAVAA